MLENLDQNILFRLGPIYINETIFYTWVVMGVLIGLSVWMTRHLKVHGKISKIQIIMEMLVLAAQGQIKDVSGDNPKKYLAFIGTFFLFIAMANLLTIIPWFKLPTSSLTTPVAFATCVFFAIPYYGVKNGGWKGYFKKFVEPTPIMLPMNIISDFSSAFSLAFRLYGNMLSGVIIGSVLLMLVPFIVPLPMQLLGLLTGTIQAYIFALLAIVYVSAVAPKEPYQPTDTKGV